MNVPRQLTTCAAVLSLLCCLILLPAKTTLAQSGPPPIPPLPWNAWSFYPLETPPWSDWSDYPARAFTNLNSAPSWDYDGKALSVNTNLPAFLQYDFFEDGYPNITFDTGSFSLWFQPSWTSVTDGGTGPTNWAALLSVGNWTSNASQSAWALAISPDGAKLVMEAQSAGSNQVVFNIPIDFDAGDWHALTVTYTPSNCCVYLEGQPVATNAPISNWPTLTDCTNYGFTVGTLNTEGLGQCHGQLQWLTMYDFPLSADEVADDYGEVSAYIGYWGGSLPPVGIGGFHPADDGPPIPGGGGGGTGLPWSPPVIPTPFFGTNGFYLSIAQTTNSTIVITLSNTVAGTHYLLLSAPTLAGPWITNQSLLATTNFVVCNPVGIDYSTNQFFIAKSIPTPALGQLRWVTHLSAPSVVSDYFGTGLDASPAVSPFGPIYLTTANSNLLSIDPIFGDVQWSVTILTLTNSATTIAPPIMLGSPSVGPDGTIYAGYIDGNLYSISPSGQTNWIRETGSSNALCGTNAIDSTPAIGNNGLIYVTSDAENGSYGTGIESGIAAFDVGGTNQWYFQPQDIVDNRSAGGNIEANPVVGPDGTIYFVSKGSRFYALSSDGQLKWFLPILSDQQPDAAPAFLPDGSLVVGSPTQFLYGVNPDGSLKWLFTMPQSNSTGQTVGQPAIGANGVIYEGSGYSAGLSGPGSGALNCINPNGSTNWTFYTTNAVVSTPALAADGTLYFGATDGTFYALSTNMTVLWSTNFGTTNAILSSPAILPDGSVVVACEDGNLYCFWGTAPLDTNALWPMFQHDPAHTGQALPTSVGSNNGAPFVFNGDNDEDGHFYFSMTGTLGSSGWNVYAATNLTNLNHWSNCVQLATNLTMDSSTGNAFFTDSNVTGLAQRFYVVAQSNCCSKVIGFVTVTNVTGTNLIADQLYQVDDGVLINGANNGFDAQMNMLNALFCISNALGSGQNGTTVFKWNGTGFDSDTLASKFRFFEVHNG